MQSAPTATLVTPSYRYDFERCELLVESIGHCAPTLKHVILVDKPDLPQFRSLQSNTTTIVDTRAVLDRSYIRLPGSSGWWIGLRTPPIRGWLTQQLRKLAIGRIVDTDIIINIDSDVAFIRHFGVEDFIDDAGRLSLFSVDYRNEEILKWSSLSRRILETDTDQTPMNHVGMMICWWRNQLENMLDAMERANGVPWQTLLGRQMTFSEYELYGTYILDKIGLDASRHFPDSRKLIETSWGWDLAAEGALARFVGDVPSDAIGLMVHSKDGIAASAYRALLAHHWRA